MNPEETTIAIMGDHVSARYMRVRIDDLEFLPDNPRVYAATREMTDFGDLTVAEKQLRIYEQLLQEKSVKNLIGEIRRDGGLQEPITVRWDRRQVIEGNSRLAVYRKLRDDTGHERWDHIRCRVVTELTNDQQTRLLAQTHLHGKTEWSPYAQALFCFRWVEEDKKDVSVLVQLSGLTAHQIRKGVKVIQMMKENNDDKQSHFSYYNVLATNRQISKELETNPDLRATLLSQIRTEEFTAQQMRQQVPTVIQKPKILRKYQVGHVRLHDAYDRARISGTQQRLRRVRDTLDDIEKSDIDGLDLNELNAVLQVIRQINRHWKRVHGMVTDTVTKRKGG